MWGRLVFQHSGHYRLLVSESVVREVVEVLQRPELRRKLDDQPGLDFRRVIDILGEAEIIELANIPAISRDPSDDKFLATAAVAEADYLVTEDKDMLVLKEHGRTAIVSAAEFLAALESA